MREVVVLGVGLHKFGRFPDKPIEDIGREAILNALVDSGVSFKDIQAAYCGRVYPGMMAGLKVVAQFGQTGIPITNIEQACASSSTAFREAHLAIAEGRFDVVLTVGFEKMPRGLLTGTTEPGSLEEVMGLNVPPAWHAMLARRHMLDYGTTREQIAMVAVKNHRNGLLNPYAQYQMAVTVEDVMNSRMVADPLTLYECSPTTDGAAAAILCSREKAAKYKGKPVTIAAYACGTPTFEHGEGDELMMSLTERLAKEAYQRSGIGPKDVDVVQLHDCFASAEIIRLEACGFCPKG
ncbi:MAG: thiolase family protein, partial [Dehalococcoidia bacterium]|nr:thiolase family protein [Dehalococcoidia bacterium]